MPGMTLRPARPGDAAAVADVRIAGWQSYAGLLDAAHVTGEDFARGARAGAATWLGEVDARGRHPSGAAMFVQETDGDVDGWVSFGPDREDAVRGEVWGLYVSPASWGSGIARRLLGAASDSLREQGFTTLVLWCLEGNERALRFYRREGWVLDGGRQTRDLGPAGSAVELRLRLAD
jgi:GNAT superfamily N-acetyltransferase